MRPRLQLATAEDAESIAALRNAISDDLTFKHGKGPWTSHCTTAGVLFNLRTARLYVALHRGEAIATLVLADKKPWAIDLKLFSKARRPVYLIAMAVTPELQRQGLGRACLEQAVQLARKAKADAIFLDAFDHPEAGAGPFYTKCGFSECGRSAYRGVPLAFHERVL